MKKEDVFLARPDVHRVDNGVIVYGHTHAYCDEKCDCYPQCQPVVREEEDGLS